MSLSLDVLVSTMHQEDYSLLEKMRIESNAVVINQCDRECTVLLKHNGYIVKWIDTCERGLSRSRNMAIKESDADICLLCDDDEMFLDAYANSVISAFDKMPYADIIAFDYISEGSKRYKKVLNQNKKANKVKRASYFKTYNSIRIAFRRAKIIEKEVYFDTRFGAGSNKISCGEETVWQRQAQLKHFTRFSYPCKIAVLKQGESTWFFGLNEKYYYDLGACLITNYNFLSYLLMFYYVFFISGSKLSKFEQIHWLTKGIKEFSTNQYSYEEYLYNEKSTRNKR